MHCKPLQKRGAKRIATLRYACVQIETTVDLEAIGAQITLGAQRPLLEVSSRLWRGLSGLHALELHEAPNPDRVKITRKQNCFCLF